MPRSFLRFSSTSGNTDFFPDKMLQISSFLNNERNSFYLAFHIPKLSSAMKMSGSHFNRRQKNGCVYEGSHKSQAWCQAVSICQGLPMSAVGQICDRPPIRSVTCTVLHTACIMRGATRSADRRHMHAKRRYAVVMITVRFFESESFELFLSSFSFLSSLRA